MTDCGPKVGSGPCENKDPRIRDIVNACWNCKKLNISTDAEHEDGGGDPYCLMDGCSVRLFNICKDWEEDS
jgi:hypothetical protein